MKLTDQVQPSSKSFLIIVTMNPLPLTFIFINLILLLVLASPSTSTASASPGISPAPWSATVLTRPPTISPAPAPLQPHGLVPVNEKCWRRCRDAAYLTACLESSQTDSKEAFLLVKNDGDCTINVNFTIFEAKTAVSDWKIEIPKHDTKKINVSAIVGGSRSVVLSAGNGECLIQLGSNFGLFSLYTTHATPIYLLFFSAIIVGVTLACCKSRTRSRHHSDGVSYHELEMEKADSLSVDNVETKQGWDSAWGETETEAEAEAEAVAVAVAVHSPAARQLRNVSAKGLNSKSSDKEGWENNWND